MHAGPGLRPSGQAWPQGAGGGAGCRAAFPGQPALLCTYWFSLNVPITQASVGTDRNKCRKAAQPAAGMQSL